MKILECSSKGDKRFSAFYALVEVNGVVNSIEHFYQVSKRGDFPVPKKALDGKGKIPDYFVFCGKEYHDGYGVWIYEALWLKYFKMHPELLEYMLTFDDYNDMFGKKGMYVRQDWVMKRIKAYGYDKVLKENKLLRVMNGEPEEKVFVEREI